MQGPHPKPASAQRILLLTHRVPCPPDKGDRIRSYHLLLYLAGQGSVDLATFADEEIRPETQATLNRLCRRVLVVPLSRRQRYLRAAWNLLRGKSATEGLFFSRTFRKELDLWLTETAYDAVVCFSSGTLPYVLNRGLGPCLVADLVDVDSQKWFDYAERSRPPLSWVFRTEGRRLRGIECAAQEARATVFISEAEATLFRGFCPEARVIVIPNGVDLDYYRPQAAQEDGSCVFVGYLDYRANVLGLEWFCREVWPRFRQDHPEAVFHIVGRNPVPAVQRLARVPGVRVVGPVPDVRSWIAPARMVVVPLTVARGVQNKVLEALAMGKAVLATPAALEGLEVRPGVEAFSARTAEQWCESLHTLWEDEQRRGELGTRGRKYVEAHHNWDNCLEPFRALLPPGRDVASDRGRPAFRPEHVNGKKEAETP